MFFIVVMLVTVTAMLAKIGHLIYLLEIQAIDR